MFGTALGVLVLGTLSNGLILLRIPAFYQYLARGAVLLLAVGLDYYRGRIGSLMSRRSTRWTARQPRGWWPGARSVSGSSAPGGGRRSTTCPSWRPGTTSRWWPSRGATRNCWRVSRRSSASSTP